MKYLFIILAAWTIGYILPLLATFLQAAIAVVFVGLVVLCVMYYIHTRITAIRL